MTRLPRAWSVVGRQMTQKGILLSPISLSQCHVPLGGGSMSLIARARPLPSASGVEAAVLSMRLAAAERRLDTSSAFGSNTASRLRCSPRSLVGDDLFEVASGGRR